MLLITLHVVVNLTMAAWVTTIQEARPKEGDLIEFNRITYSHWGIYYGNGEIVHFHPIDNSDKVGPHRLKEFVPGIVTKDRLSKVQDQSGFRVNNQPNFGKAPNSLKTIRIIIEAILGKRGFYYCLNFFNCEHFVTFVKFGKAKSSQIDFMNSVLTLSLSQQLQVEEYLNRCATKQWEENLEASWEGRRPTHFLQEKTNFWNTTEFTLEQLGINK